LTASRVERRAPYLDAGSDTKLPHALPRERADESLAGHTPDFARLTHRHLALRCRQRDPRGDSASRGAAVYLPLGEDAELVARTRVGCTNGKSARKDGPVQKAEVGLPGVGNRDHGADAVRDGHPGPNQLGQWRFHE